MERLCDLYFEFSNEDRLSILHKLEDNGMNVTGMTREIGISIQACSRHLSRLSHAGLVERKPEGFYILTQYGRASLRLISGQQFITEHKDYFNAHTVERLPLKFLSHISELQGSDPMENVMVTFGLLESLFKNAEEHVSMIHDQYILNILPLGVEALKRGVKIRSLEPSSKEPRRVLNPVRPDYLSEEDEDYLLRSWLDGKVDSRFSDTIDLFLYASDKEALIAFPHTDGAFGYLGFYSTDHSARRYCSDLFDYYFEKGGRPSRQSVEEYHEKRKAYHRERK